MIRILSKFLRVSFSERKESRGADEKNNERNYDL